MFNGAGTAGGQKLSMGKVRNASYKHGESKQIVAKTAGAATETGDEGLGNG